MTVEDPFAGPAPIVSQFPSAASFRGRLVLIKPTKLELQIPSADDPTKLSDRITATVTVVDGKGDVQMMPGQMPSGIFVPGPEYIGVWFAQDRIVNALRDVRTNQLFPLVLARIDTRTPGQRAARGNPWGLIDPTEEDKQTARDFLAGRTVAAAAPPKNPFGGDAPF